MSKFVCVADFEEWASTHFQRNAWLYCSTGADDEITIKDNVEAFRRIKLRPRVLRDVSKRDLSTTLLGQRVSFPVGIAPTGVHKASWPEGECATAKAAAAAGVCYAMSTLSTCTHEEVAAAAPDALKWFQLYILKDREWSAELVRIAERTGFKAIVFTVDGAIWGQRRANLREPYRGPPYAKMELMASKLKTTKGDSLAKGTPGGNKMDIGITWKDIAWIKSITKLPVIVKGILAAEDAVLAVKYGADAIVVSNHGGRQLDTSPASIDVLEEIVAAVDGRLEVYLDGGVRTGTDILKALALGARAVFIGRPAIYGLGYQGASGVKMVLDILKEEFSTAMALSGCSSVKDINSSLISRHMDAKL